MRPWKIFQSRKSPPPSLSSCDSRSSSSPRSSDLSSAAEMSQNREKSRSGSQTRRSGSNMSDSSSLNRVARESPRAASPAADAELAATFKMFDSNGDGRISASELGAVLRSFGDDPSDEDLKLMVEAVDRNGDGHIDLQEFITLNKMAGDVAGKDERSEELRAVFHLFDRDRNNYISAAELHQVLSGLGQRDLTMEECNKMIDGVDSDGNGLVDFEEFERMMSTSNFF